MSEKARPVLLKYKVVIALSVDQWDWLEEQAKRRGETGGAVASALLSQAIFLARQRVPVPSAPPPDEEIDA